MKKMLIVVLAVLLGIWIGQGRAQTVPTALQITGSAPHTTCAVAVATTTFCFANDGLWISINGGAYAQAGSGAGVTSFNGRTGAVVPVPSDYPDAVTSVNGKTGAVVISAASTTTTTLQ